MIVIEHKPLAVLVSVAGQFTLADYHQFEEDLLYEMKFHGKPALLLDLTEMLDYTLDVVWEELRFTRAHANDFGRVAVVTNDQWLTWATWISRLFINSEVQVFGQAEEGERWLQETGAE